MMILVQLCIHIFKSSCFVAIVTWKFLNCLIIPRTEWLWHCVCVRVCYNLKAHFSSPQYLICHSSPFNWLGIHLQSHSHLSPTCRNFRIGDSVLGSSSSPTWDGARDGISTRTALTMRCNAPLYIKPHQSFCKTLSAIAAPRACLRSSVADILG